MTPKQGRAQIYDFLFNARIDYKVHDGFRKLLKQYGRTETTIVLEKLRNRLAGSIEKGKGNPLFAPQVVVLESMLKWTDKKLSMNATKSI